MVHFWSWRGWQLFKHIGPCSFSIKLAELPKHHHLRARCWLSAVLAKSKVSWGVSEVGGWRFFKDNGACLIIFNHMWPNFQDIIISKNVLGFKPRWLSKHYHIVIRENVTWHVKTCHICRFFECREGWLKLVFGGSIVNYNFYQSSSTFHKIRN